MSRGVEIMNMPVARFNYLYMNNAGKFVSDLTEGFVTLTGNVLTLVFLQA